MRWGPCSVGSDPLPMPTVRLAPHKVLGVVTIVMQVRIVCELNP